MRRPTPCIQRPAVVLHPCLMHGSLLGRDNEKQCTRVTHSGPNHGHRDVQGVRTGWPELAEPQSKCSPLPHPPHFHPAAATTQLSPHPITAALGPPPHGLHTASSSPLPSRVADIQLPPHPLQPSRTACWNWRRPQPRTIKSLILPSTSTNTLRYYGTAYPRICSKHELSNCCLIIY